MSNPKIKNVSKNIVLSVLSNSLGLLFSFIVRKVFVTELGNEFVGLNSLFTNILGIVSFAELGIGVAITAALYKPLQRNNYAEIQSYLNFYKKFMNIVALVIETAGVVIGFFIPIMIHNQSEFSMLQLWLYFFLYTTTSAASYVLTYKRVLLTADQTDYLNSVNNLVFKVLTAICQIAMLIIWHSYILYLLTQIILIVVSNILISKKIEKNYKHIFIENKEAKLTKKNIIALRKSITGMISAKIGGIILTSTDNIIISIFLGLSILGKYANYTMLIAGISLILNQIFNSLTPTIGNVVFSNTKRDNVKELELYNKILRISYALVLFSSAGFAMFCSSFVKIWLGNDFILPINLTSVIVINFAINQFRQAGISFMSAYGLFWQQRYKSILEAILNISVSIILIKYFGFGIYAVLLGTIVTNLFFNLFWEFSIIKRNAVLLVNPLLYFTQYIASVGLLLIFVVGNANLSLFYQVNFSFVVCLFLLMISFLLEITLCLIIYFSFYKKEYIYIKLKFFDK